MKTREQFAADQEHFVRADRAQFPQMTLAQYTQRIIHLLRQYQETTPLDPEFESFLKQRIKDAWEKCEPPATGT